MNCLFASAGTCARKKRKIKCEFPKGCRHINVSVLWCEKPTLRCEGLADRRVRVSRHTFFPSSPKLNKKLCHWSGTQGRGRDGRMRESGEPEADDQGDPAKTGRGLRMRCQELQKRIQRVLCWAVPAPWRRGHVLWSSSGHPGLCLLQKSGNRIFIEISVTATHVLLPRLALAQIPIWLWRTRRRRPRGISAPHGPLCWTTTACESRAEWRMSLPLQGWAAPEARSSVRAMLGCGSRLSCFLPLSKKCFYPPSSQRPEFLLTKPPQLSTARRGLESLNPISC